MTATKTVCRETVFDGRWSQKCGRPVKEDGMCGPHLAGRKRSQAAAAKRAEKYAAEKAVQREGKARVALLDTLGIRASEHYSGITNAYTGGITLSPSETDALIDRLVAAKPTDGGDYERKGVLSCAADDRDDKHPNCRHAWNAAHPDDLVTEAEQAEYQARVEKAWRMSTQPWE